MKNHWKLYLTRYATGKLLTWMKYLILSKVILIKILPQPFLTFMIKVSTSTNNNFEKSEFER